MVKTILLATLVAVFILPISAAAQTNTPAPILKGQCPVTKIVGELEACLRCHAMSGAKFTLKEFPTDAHLSYPNNATTIREGKGYFLLEGIDGERFEKSLEYFKSHGIKHVVIQLHSPGGSLMAAWKIVGLIREAQAEGVIIETRVYGMAASGGLILFAAGTKGYRIASPTAELMWHELLSFKFFDVSGPSDKEDEAKVLRHLQDTANNFISSVSRLSKTQIEEKTRKKEFWMTGVDAYKNGIADKLIGGESKVD